MKPEDKKNISDWDKLFSDETEEKKLESQVSDRSNNSNDWDNIFSDNNTVSVEKKPEDQKYHSSNYANQPQQTNNSDAAKWGWGIGGVVLFLIILFAFIIPSTSNNTGSSGGSSSSNYSLTGSSLKEGYGGSWNYTGRLSNTTNQTHEYRVSVYIYDSGGRVLASKSEHYILAGGGSGTISIFLFPGNTWATYEVLVTGIKKT